MMNITKGNMMRAHYKPILFVLLGLTVFWCVVILFCLPPESSPLLWSSHYDHDYRIHRNSARIHHSPEGPKFMKYFQTSRHHNLSLPEILFYEFEPNPSTSEILNPFITKSEHEKATLNLKSIRNPTDHHVKTQGNRLFAFNLLISNRIGLIRPLPDTRNHKCKETQGISHTNLKSKGISNDHRNVSIRETASIVICYYNEAPSALLRTIFSVIQRSPSHLIKEIIVVDDFSQSEYHMNHVKHFIDPNIVTMVRTKKREGLIRARLFGADIATGDVLIFLDSHVEANIGWLEPLLSTVQDFNTTIACPMIDLINAETLVYSASPMVKGGMNWALNFKWDSVPSEQLKTYDDFVKPIESPTMAGGLYAINRKFFYHLGAYDSEMELWGGENVELSLRTWMCGGKILILPCSRLGHIFRKRRPYGPDQDKPDSLLVNLQRTARVWLDDYIDNFYKSNSDARYLPDSDISKRAELRRSLNCKNFSWFLDNVYPSLKRELNVSSESKISKESGSKQLPKLFNLKPKRVDRSLHYSSSDDKTYYGITQFKRRSKSNRRIDIEDIQSFKPVKDKGHANALVASKLSIPNVVARFQIQSIYSNMCIESAGLIVKRGFSRLVMGKCAHNNQMKPGGDSETSENSSYKNQLWTLTEMSDYRLNDNQCLDLMKNLPLLRSCHTISSFQEWKSHNKSTNTQIFNSRARLCLGVEKVQIGEPIIVTICDRELSNPSSSNLNQRKFEISDLSGNELPSGAWQAKTLLGTKRNSVKFRSFRPHQRWNLIYAR